MLFYALTGLDPKQINNWFINQRNIEAKLHGESKVIQRCFDDNKNYDKGDDKKLKDQSKDEFKMESRTIQDSRRKS